MRRLSDDIGDCGHGDRRGAQRLVRRGGRHGDRVLASASLTRLPWLRWVAIAWWLGELALFALRHRAEALPLSAALMLLLLAGPGYVLMSRRVCRAEA
jgi:hypothetical protein